MTVSVSVNIFLDKMFQHFIPVFICSVLTYKAEGYKLKSYNLNKYLSSNFKFDCLHTSRTNITIPPSFTFCYRHKPVVTHSRIWGSVFIGNLNEDWTDVTSGFDFGIWSYGPWVAARHNGTVSWISMGKGEGFELLAWRHTCMTINFVDGKSSLYENGKLQFEDKSDELLEFGDKMPASVNMISVGCAHGLVDTYDYKYSNVGQVTDFQLFGRILSKLEMEEWTGCSKRFQGDVIRWDSESWHFNMTEGVSEIDYLQFEQEVCDMREESNHIFPIQATFAKSLKLCDKVSGKLFQ